MRSRDPAIDWPLISISWLPGAQPTIGVLGRVPLALILVSWSPDIDVLLPSAQPRNQAIHVLGPSPLPLMSWFPAFDFLGFHEISCGRLGPSLGPQPLISGMIVSRLFRVGINCRGNAINTLLCQTIFPGTRQKLSNGFSPPPDNS